MDQDDIGRPNERAQLVGIRSQNPLVVPPLGFTEVTSVAG
jgi:hypothetical protein